MNSAALTEMGPAATAATPTVPALADAVQLLPFDSSSVEKRFLLVRSDGRRWHVSEYLASVIGAINGSRDAEQIAAHVSAAMARPVRPQDIERVLSGFLSVNGILAGSAPAQGGNPEEKAQVASRSRSTTLRLPLIWGRPLGLVTRCMTWLFRGPLAWPTLIAMLTFQIGWSLTHLKLISLATHITWANEIVTVLALLLGSLFLHEFGHAAACRAFGAKEGEIGFAIYLVFPVFYCDVTDAWKLTRRERAALDLAGLYTQGLVASVMLAAYIVTWKDVFLFTFLAISASYVPNLNPFLKMDGYWFLSDMLGVANLSQRVGELLRGDRSTMQTMSRVMASLTYLYLAASIAYMTGFFFWLGRFAVAMLRGGYVEKLRNVLMDSFSDPAGMLPDMLTLLISTMVLIFLPFLAWRTLRGCVAWVRDIAGIFRRQRTS